MNGFCKDVHFKESCKTTIETRTVRLGYTYNNTDFETEVTAEYSQSDIYLLGQSFDSYKGELKSTKFYFDVEKDKIQCGSITEQYRFYKPRTLLEKLKYHNENAVYRFEEHQKKTNLEKSVIEKYTKLYPNAAIIAKDDWNKYSGSYRVIEVRFESGSYIQFKLDLYNLKEYEYKKHDATFEKLTTAEVLAGITFRAAAALNLFDRGKLIAGNKADFILYSTTDYRDILYYQGSLRPSKIWKSGKLVSASSISF
jgi:hypothetical protein